MKPIIFSTEMVRAILAGTKTQTRRVIKPQPVDDAVGLPNTIVRGHHFILSDKFKDGDGSGVNPHNLQAFIRRCAKYQPGDILYVRETWCRGTARDGGEKTIYKADIEPELACIHKWRPSIHMPREAARIFLKVTDVRVERVQDISEEDAIAEGCFAGMTIDGAETPALTAKQGYMWLRDSLNAKRGFGWAGNPWVWAYAFERSEASRR